MEIGIATSLVSFITIYTRKRNKKATHIDVLGDPVLPFKMSHQPGTFNRLPVFAFLDHVHNHTQTRDTNLKTVLSPGVTILLLQRIQRQVTRFCLNSHIKYDDPATPPTRIFMTCVLFLNFCGLWGSMTQKTNPYDSIH